MPKEKLTMADYERAAGLLDVPVPTIRAVTAVESGGTGFLNDDRCVIRFEPHIFCRRTGGIYNTSHSDCSFTPRRMGYPTSVDQSWTLFRTAASLNPKAAVMATSWGLFQIMGFHYGTCGCETLTEFVEKMENSEGEQLALFCEFILSMNLDDTLRARNWAGFAKLYNGATYRTNQYDRKLKQAFERYSEIPA